MVIDAGIWVIKMCPEDTVKEELCPLEANFVCKWPIFTFYEDKDPANQVSLKQHQYNVDKNVYELGILGWSKQTLDNSLR